MKLKSWHGLVLAIVLAAIAYHLYTQKKKG
jgi:hypothetical protein